jgi:Fur family ferric uptake transcriptional regulator
MKATSAKQLSVQIERDLKKNGRSLTRQRRVIISEILRSGAHFDIESLADRTRCGDPSIGHATVYRTVRLLAGQGLIKKRMLGEMHSHYEIVRKDHGHFICTSCGRIVELGCPTLDNFLATASKSHDFKIHRHSIELFGVCGKCGRKDRQMVSI